MSAVANTTMLSKNNPTKKRKNVTTSEECNKKSKTKPAATFKHFKKLVNGDNKASDYAKTTGGIIIARDNKYFHKKKKKLPSLAKKKKKHLPLPGGIF